MIFDKNKQPKPPYIPANNPHPAVVYKGEEAKLVNNPDEEAAAKKLGFTSTAPNPNETPDEKAADKASAASAKTTDALKAEAKAAADKASKK